MNQIERTKNEMWDDLADEYILLQRFSSQTGGYESIVVRKTKDNDPGMVNWTHCMVFPTEYSEQELDTVLDEVYDCKQSDFDADSIMGFFAAYLADIQDSREVSESWALERIKELTGHDYGDHIVCCQGGVNNG